MDATRGSIQAWFGAGVCCVGIGSNLITKDALANGDYAPITARTREILDRIRQARQGRK